MRRHSVRWSVFRIALAAAAVSQLIYIPYRYATLPPTIDGPSGILSPFSTVLAGLGIALALGPERSVRMPALARLGVGCLAGAWLLVGLVCVPSLVASVLQSPGRGLFATFQMLAQHVFLSTAVTALTCAP